MGETSHTDSGWLDRASQVSGFERAAKQFVELARSFSWVCQLAQTSTPRSKDVPAP